MNMGKSHICNFMYGLSSISGGDGAVNVLIPGYNFLKNGHFCRIFSLLPRIVYEYSLFSVSLRETIMYIMGKFKVLNFLILRLRMKSFI